MKHKILLFLFAALMMCQCVLSLRADVHYIAVASDRHGPEDEDDWEDYDINTCSVVLGLSGITDKVEYVCLDGDMVGSKGGSDGRNAPPYNSSEVMTEVNYLFPDLTKANVAIVYADHDGGCDDDAEIMKCNDGDDPNTTGQSQLIYTGKTAAGKVAYYVYGVSFASMYGTGNACNGDADGPARFKAWVDTTDPSVPIIVASHVPLHCFRNDNVGAVAWSKALNYAATGKETVSAGETVIRNVIFFHGHNHTTEGGNTNPYEYYLPVGSNMIVGKSYTESNRHVIYYTYTTAGYLRDRHASTLITIDGKNVKVSKYVEGSLKKEEAYRGSAFKKYYYSQTFASSGFVTGSPNVIDRTSPSLTFQNDGNSNVSQIARHDGRIYDVTLNGRTLYKDGHWNTLCLPFDVDLTDPTSPLYGATAKTLTSASFDASTGELALNFEKTTGTSSNHWEVKDYMYAGKPYLVKWNPETPSTIENPTFYGVTVNKGDNPVVIQQDGEDLIEFKGIFEPVSFAEEDRSVLYLGGDDYLYYPSPADQDVKIGAFRAYFQLKGDLKAQAASSNGVKAFRLNFGEDETTSIRLVNSSSIDEKGSDCYYMLDGRRLNGRPTEKGIYILRGKKIVIH